jgi:hypothetical protein
MKSELILEKLLIEKFKVSQIHRPVFYNFPIGIRYEIGVGSPYIEDGSINGDYVKNAVSRAEMVFQKLEFSNNILVIFDCFHDENNQYNLDTVNILKSFLNNIIDPEVIELNENIVDEDKICYRRYFFYTTLDNFNYKDLFSEIAKADIGGSYDLASSVFIFDLEKDILYYLYDDRGLDVVASKISTLYPIYEEFNDWILDYDRLEIEELFNLLNEY